MEAKFYLVLELSIAGFESSTGSGTALARVVEAHPILETLIDFVSIDPVQVALAVGMVYPYEEDGVEDLQDIDFGSPQWYEAVLGLAAIRRALKAVRDDPGSIAAAIYDPGLRPAAVIADLEAIERTLLLAQQHETRFHFVLEAGKAPHSYSR